MFSGDDDIDKASRDTQLTLGRESADPANPHVRLGPDAFVLYPGGVRRAALELLDALRSQGVTVDVAERAERWCRSGRPAASSVERALLQVEELGAVGRARRKEAPVVNHSFYYDASQFAEGRPKVVTVHDMTHERFRSGTVLRVLKKRAVFGADCIVTISAATAKDVTRFYAGSPRCVVIPLGLSASILEPPADPIELGRPYLLYVGPRTGYKNFKVLVEALPLLARHGLGLVLAGGEPLTDGERRKLALNLGAGDALLHIRPDDRDLVRLYDGAAAMVITSECEGFGLPLLEAMARGCPVATSTGGSLPEVAAGMAELFRPDSAAACAEAIGRALVKEPQCLVEASTHARAFTWENTARRHIDLYQELSVQ